MKIDRHNYESFFILYIDQELNSDDRRRVEEFVMQHPDLKDELDLLQQFKLNPEPAVVFPGKEELMKFNGDSPVTLSNYGEWLVLYIDNELNPAQRKQVEKFLESHPPAKKELVLLQKSKIQPEEIVFTNKESLYRREEKVRPIFFQKWRIAVAAVLLLGIGITTAVILNNRTSGKNEIVKGREIQKNSGSEVPVIKTVDNQQEVMPQNAVADNVQKPNTPLVKQDNKTRSEKNKINVVREKSPVNIPLPEKNTDPVIAENNKPSNNLPQPINNPNINKNNDALVFTDPSPEKNNQQGSLTENPVTKSPEETSPTKNPDIMYASLEEGGKNKKNRGFIRKLARTFEKRTNITTNDDNRLLVGGLAFKLK